MATENITDKNNDTVSEEISTEIAEETTKKSKKQKPDNEAHEGGVLSTIADFVSTFITTIIVIAAVAIVAIRLMGWSMYSVDSYSMEPAYPIDSLVIVQNVEPETIQIGDVITYVLNEDGVLVTHRVTAIDRSNETFTTKGDANASADSSPALWGNVVGKVVLCIPKLGALLRVVTDEGNRPIVIGIIVVLLVISFGFDFVSKQMKKKKAKNVVAVEEAIAAEKPDTTDESLDDVSPETEPESQSSTESEETDETYTLDEVIDIIHGEDNNTEQIDDTSEDDNDPVDDEENIDDVEQT
ncbi:MAG: signal peptidase I [Oscillospiraceae bacterium]|nr:signal peptidase I [Oscillospiraceae bacterium]